MKKCPECRAECEPGHKHCIECGARLLAGAVAPPAPPPEPVEEGVPLRVLHWVLELAPGLATPKVLVHAAVATGCALVELYLARVCFRAAISGSLMVIMAAPGVFLSATAALTYCCILCWLFCGVVCLPQEALAEFKRKHWLALAALVLGPLALLFGLLKAAGG